MLKPSLRSLRSALTIAMMATALMWIGGPAMADGPSYNPGTGANSVDYSNTIPGGDGSSSSSDSSDSGSGGEPAEPTCDLSAITPSQYDTDATANFCNGTEACYTAGVLPPYALPSGKKPDENSQGMITRCSSGGAERVDRIFWSDDAEPEPPSLAEQAQTAIGQINLGTPDVGISPQNRTLVNLDTWFWVDGVQAQAQGSSALGLVAIALDPALTVDPGDGSGGMTCPLVTSSAQAEDSCAHIYRRASTNGTASVEGRPAYGVDVQVVYRLEFRLNGTVVNNIPGVPPTLTAGADAAPLRVDEVQSRVTGLR